MHWMPEAFNLPLFNAGNRNAAKVLMTAMTTSNSTSVKPLKHCRWRGFLMAADGLMTGYIEVRLNGTRRNRNLNRCQGLDVRGAWEGQVTLMCKPGGMSVVRRLFHRVLNAGVIRHFIAGNRLNPIMIN